jgi:hypothetical protein
MLEGRLGRASHENADSGLSTRVCVQVEAEEDPWDPVPRSGGSVTRSVCHVTIIS